MSRDVELLYYLLYHFSFPLLQCHRAIQTQRKEEKKREIYWNEAHTVLKTWKNVAILEEENTYARLNCKDIDNFGM